MKYYYYIGIIALCFQINAIAQPQPHKLSAGDNAPPLRPLKWIKGASFDRFEKGQIYILEFGATWCVPCIKMIPKLTSLAEQYKGKATVVSLFVMEQVTADDFHSENPAYVSRVEKFVARQGDKIKYTIAIDDPGKTIERIWLKAAHKNGIPTTFVINQQGKIEWIGNNHDQLMHVVDRLVNGLQVKNSPLISKPVQDLPTKDNYDKGDLLMSSALTNFTKAEKGNVNPVYVENYKWLSTESDSAISIGKLKCAGCSLRQLYYLAYADTLWNHPLSRIPSKGIFYDTAKAKHYRRSYGNYWYRPILELKDTSAFETIPYSFENKYNYSLFLSPERSTSQKLQQLMRNDLQNTFGYSVTVEKQRMPCWKLVTAPEGKRKLKTKTPGQKFRGYLDNEGNYHIRNAEVRDLIFQLEIRYGRKSDDLTYSEFQPPFIDETNITGEIDYDVDKEILDKLAMEKESGIKFTFEQYRKVLLAMGIQLVKGEKLMNVVVIRDPTPMP